jgi:hypothetical protein
MLRCVLQIYIIRFQLYRSEAKPGASYISSIMNTIQIQFFTYVYGQVSSFLNDRENHQTDTAYEDSMIVKNFVFIFINTFSSFFFLGELLAVCLHVDDLFYVSLQPSLLLDWPILPVMMRTWVSAVPQRV